MMSSTLEGIKLTKKDESQIAAGPPCRKMANNSSTSNKKNQMKTKKQYVWIVRNGLTKYPLVDGVCPFDSELDPFVGIQQAKCIAQRLAADGSKAPVAVYTSPFRQAVHTAQLVALELRKPSVRVEEGLTDWTHKPTVSRSNSFTENISNGNNNKGVLRASCPILPFCDPDEHGEGGESCINNTMTQSPQRLAQTYGTIDLSYKSLNSLANCGIYAEPEQHFIDRCAATMTCLLKHQGTESFCIVSHAPCNQALALHISNKNKNTNRKESSTNDSNDDDGSAKLSPMTEAGAWPMGGVSLFSRDVLSNGSPADDWTVEFYGCTQHMPGKYKPGLHFWSLPSLDNGTRSNNSSNRTSILEQERSKQMKSGNVSPSSVRSVPYTY